MPVNMRENSNSTQGSTRRTLSKQPSENSNEGSASMKIQFTVRQHPSGDRYIITPRSVQEHRSPGYSADTQRSTRSTPGGMRFLETEDPEEYQRYYMGWRGLATSKADREAETLLYNQLSRNPMSRFVESRGSGEGAGRTWERGATPQPAPKKPLSLKEKRQRHLERMKRGWGVTDSGADKNAELSTEDFLNASNSSSRPASAQRRPGTGGSRNQLRSSGSREVQERGGGASGSRAGGVESSSRVLGQKQHTQQGGSAGPAKVGGRGGGVTAAGRPWSGKRGAKEKGAPFATQDPSNGGSGGGGESEGATPGSVSRDGHRLAREARDALVSAGVELALDMHVVLRSVSESSLHAVFGGVRVGKACGV